MALIEREMPVNYVAEMLGINLQRVWTVFRNTWKKGAPEEQVTVKNREQTTIQWAINKRGLSPITFSPAGINDLARPHIPCFFLYLVSILYGFEELTGLDIKNLLGYALMTWIQDI